MTGIGQLDEDPVVIVGMGCRYPGTATSPEKFWDMVSNARSAHGKVPANRFNVDAYYHPNADRQGALYVKHGYFMDKDPGCFDAPFFSMTATEAAGTDPMQRMFLEVVYEALENAGIPMTKLPGSATSVYVGSFTKDYEELSGRDIYHANPYSATGVGRSMLSNRISWFFDLAGPSLTLDTACSSSLIALHLGCQSILTGETDTSIVAGGNIILGPDLIRHMCAMRFMSPDGKCHSFDARANGYARGEGFGALILKRLSKAIADGDTIRAIIRGTGSNQDGKTPGITMPSAKAQAALIESCYKKAGLDYDTTGYFEAHGTGTPLGDPLELSSLGMTFGKERDPASPLYVSSVKTNIGHQEGGAGVAGVIRSVLAMEKGLIPPLAGFEKPNPKLELEKWKVALPTECIPWPQAGIRRSSVNSFGYGGANAHVILDDAYHYLKSRNLPGKHLTAHTTADSSDGSDSGVNMSEESYEVLPTSRALHRVFAFSATDQAALQRMWPAYQEWLSSTIAAKHEDPSTIFENLSYTLADRRTTFDRRAYVVADSLESLQSQLQNAPSSRKINREQNLLFVFTGQGAQYAQQGKELLQYPVFRDSVNKSADVLKALGCSWDLMTEMLKPAEESNINMPEFSQTLCTVLQVAEIELLKFWNVLPKTVVGHSSGEIAAAYAFGAISHTDAVKIAYLRGVYSGAVNTRMPELKGSMMAVGMSAESVAPYLEGTPIVIACVNSPMSVTLSGDAEHIIALEERFNKDDVFARRLKVQTAYHSPHMKHVADDYLNAMGKITTLPVDGKVRMISSVTSGSIEADQLGSEYWVANMLQPVQFSAALEKAVTLTESARGRRAKTVQYAAIVEVGPHEALKGPVKQLLNTMDNGSLSTLEYCSMLSRGKNAVGAALEVAGKLWTLGFPIELTTINNGDALTSMVSLVDLPSYSWNHGKLFWHEAYSSKARRQLQQPRTDLLGVPIEQEVSSEPTWRNIIRIPEAPWLNDHKVQGALILPGVAQLVTALEAARALAEPGRKVAGFKFREVVFQRGLMLPSPSDKLDVALKVSPYRTGSRGDTAPWYEYTYNSYPEESFWQCHSKGRFSIVYENDPNEVDCGREAKLDWDERRAQYESMKERAVTKMSHGAFYKNAENMGYEYGPTFRGVEEVNINLDGSYWGSTAITDTKNSMPMGYEFDHLLHPTTLDCILQLSLGPASFMKSTSEESWVPVSMDEVFISADVPKGVGARFRAYGHVERTDTRTSNANIVVSDDEFSAPKIVFKNIKAMSLSSVTGGMGQGEAEKANKCAKMTWVERSRNNPPSFDDLPTLSTLEPSLLKRLNEVVHTIQRAVKALEMIDTSRASNNLDVLLKVSRDVILPAFGRMTIGGHPLVYPDGVDSPELYGFVSDLTNSLESADKLVLRDDLRAALNELSAAWMEASNARLAEWFDKLLKESPAATILLLGDGTSSAALYLAQIFAGRASKAVLAETSTTALDRSKAYLKAKGIDDAKIATQVIDLGKANDESYDIIIAPNCQNSTAIQALQSRLLPQGLIVLTGLKLESDPSTFFNALDQDWTKVHDVASLVSEKSGQNALNDMVSVRHSESPESTMTSATAPKLAENILKEQTVYLLVPTEVPAEVAPLVQHVKQRLEQAGHKAEHVTIDEAQHLKNQTVVSFLDLCEDFLINLTEKDFEAFKQSFVNVLRIFWLTRGAQSITDNARPLQAMAVGLMRTFSTEHTNSLPVVLDLSTSANLSSSTVQDLVTDLIDETMFDSDIVREREYTELDGKLWVPRLLYDWSMHNELSISAAASATKMELLVQEDRPLRLEIGNPGILDSIRWADDPTVATPLGPDEVEFRATAMSLNFIDIMAALGQIPTDEMGCEAAGVVTRVGSEVKRFKPGQHIIGVCRHGFRTLTRNHEMLIQEIPAGMKASEAASCVTVYNTAYCALVDTARMQKGESILIHAAAGGLGQATIQLAKWIGAEIFVTVGTNAKKQLIMDRYGIPEDHIFSSRDSSFHAGVMRMTKGKGVDVILNSLAGELLRLTWMCIADFGRFIEVGKRDIVENTGLEMAPFYRQVTFASVNVDYLEQHNRPAYARLMKETFDLLRAGVISAVHPVTEYTFTELEKALRLMQAGKHSGKIVLTVNDTDMVPVLPPPPPKVELDPKGTYVLCGGLGGIGRSLTRLLFEYGAGRVVFVSRSGASKPEAKEFMQKMQQNGFEVEAFACDTSDAVAVRSFMEESDKKGWKIKGFMQCAMALRNRAVANLSWDDWETTLKSKVPSTVNFHDVLPKDLDFFIMLSSTTGILGAPGQGNYAAGNTYQDAFAYYRRSLGLSGIAVDLGVVSDVGYVAEHGGVNAFDRFTGFEELHVSEKDIHRVMSAAMLGRTADGEAFPAQVVIGIGSALLEHTMFGQPFIRNPRFAHLLQKDGVGGEDADAAASLKASFAGATSIREAAGLFLEPFRTKLARAIMIEDEDIDVTRPLHSYGVDSLVAVEIRNWIMRELKSEVALFDLLAPIPLSTLALKVASRSKLLSGEAIKADLESVNQEIGAAVL